MIRQLGYSLGALGTAFAGQAFATYVIFFYVDVVKLPVYLAGLALLIYAVWNAINDPVAGFISDRTRSRYGRRLPYLAACLLPLGLVFYLIWVPPFRGLDQYRLLFGYFLAAICLFDGLLAFVGINWSALFPEMFLGFRERLAVNSYRQLFGLFGLILAIGLPPYFYSVWGWGAMGAAGGALIVLVLLLSLSVCRERPAFKAPPDLAFRRALAATLFNRSFLSFVAANFFAQFALLTMLAAIPFYAKYVLHAGTQTVMLVLATASLSSLVMLFGWRLPARWLGAKRMFMTALLLLAAALQPLFGVVSLDAVLLDAVLIGAALAGYFLICDVVIADIIDEDELRTGQRREGAYFGMNVFVTRFSVGLQALALSAVFLFCGYNPYIYTQPRGFAAGLRLLIAGLPAIALLLGFVIMIFYPLSGRRLAEVREQLREAHLKKGVN
ncbi:MAG: MFS transporter [Candidatus Saganbacteria bacterium]|nr:MFS transporter [Candidatus Saganbacteria bacterium]